MRTNAYALAAIVLVLGCGAATQAAAALDMFMRLEGVNGDSTDPGHVNEIPVLAWSNGASSNGSALHRAQSAGKVNVQDVSVTVFQSKASPVLYTKMTSGQVIPTAILTVGKNVDGKNVVYVTYTFRNVIVTSMSFGGSGGEDRLTENFSLGYSRIETEYKTLDVYGAVKEVATSCFDAEQNVNC